MKNFLIDKRGRSKIPLAKSRLFWFGLILKIGLALFFASPYLKELFAPFADYFIENGEDPYNYFMREGSGNEFPYPPLMLWIFSLPRWLLSPIFPVDYQIFSLAESLIFRFPLLLADFVILLVLMRWLKTRTREVLIWYWCSPVLIYINYFHGQLDVIPMSFMMVSLYLLFKHQSVLAFVFLGFAIACKTNMLLVLPFYFLYIVKNSRVDFKSVVAAVASLAVVLLLVNWPFIHSQGMIQMVYNNPVQQQVFDLYYQFNSHLRIYFIPSIYFILLVVYFSFKFVNRDQLILFLAFTFLALTLMIAPMQGWYYWILPLLVYFIIRQGPQAKAVFVLLSLLYFVYFGLTENSDYLNSFNLSSEDSLTSWSVNDRWKNVAFTLLQTTLALCGFLVYKDGIGSNVQAKFLSQPYLLGIGGDSASGKSTLSNAMADVFEQGNINIIRGDDMHKWERGHANWKNFTHLDPRANQLHQDIEHARNLKSGKRIHRRNYDHNTGRFTLPKFIKPNKLIVFEGLHSFYLNNTTSVYDLKVFMNPDENLRMWWKIQRDVAKRGYSPEAVLEQLKQRETDSEKYIKTQKAQADIIASYYPLQPLNPLQQDEEPQIGLKIRVSNELNLDALLEWISAEKTLQVHHKYIEENQEITIEGEVEAASLSYMASIILPELEEIGVYNPVWRSNFEGLIQLIISFVIFEKLKQTKM